MKRIVFLISCLLCLIACNDEVVYEIIEKEKPRIELRMQHPETVQVYSTATENECIIDSIWVLVFDSSTKALKAAEHIGGDKITGNGYAIQLMPQLSIEMEVGDSVVCIANTDLHPDTANVTLHTINACFHLVDNGYYFGTEPLPMYGAMEWSLTNYTCQMIRAVAKVQIRMGESVTDVTGNFSAENVSFKYYNGAAGGYIQPTQGVIQGIPQASPYMHTQRFRILQKKNATEADVNVYFYEYPTGTYDGVGTLITGGNTTFSPYRTHIILSKDNGNNDTTFYRLDFFDATTKKYFDIRRNYHYLFTINKVRSEGYATESEAQKNPGSNIEYTIRVDDPTSVVTSNGQYAIVTSADTVFLENRVYSSENVGLARYQLPAEMSILPAGTVNKVEYKYHPNGSFFLNESGGNHLLPPLSALLSTNSNINILTLTGFQIAHVYFTVGNIKKTMVIVNKAAWNGIQQPTVVGN